MIGITVITITVKEIKLARIGTSKVMICSRYLGQSERVSTWRLDRGVMVLDKTQWAYTAAVL